MYLFPLHFCSYINNSNETHMGGNSFPISLLLDALLSRPAGSQGVFAIPASPQLIDGLIWASLCPIRSGLGRIKSIYLCRANMLKQ